MYRVIVADDEKLARDRIGRYLEQMQDVEVVASLWNGQLVKDYLENNSVDAVISDIRMPVMDGMVLAQWIQENRPECRVILISVYEDFTYAKSAIAFGVKSYLVKPIRSEELIEAVNCLIRDRNEFECKNLYIQNMQSSNQGKLLRAWLEGKQSELTDKFATQTGSLFIIEDNRTYRGNRDILPIALINIVRWSAPRCGCVFFGKKGWNYLFVLLFENDANLPSIKDIEIRAQRLLNSDFRCSKVGEFSLPEQLSFLTDTVGSRSDDAIVHIKKYINEHLSDEISRDEVAASVYMTPAYFSRYFKAKTGLSYQDYIQKLRIEEAEKMLRKGMQVKDICPKIGYLDRNYFNRIFKKYTGYTPTEYRKMYE